MSQLRIGRTMKKAVNAQLNGTPVPSTFFQLSLIIIFATSLPGYLPFLALVWVSLIAFTFLTQTSKTLFICSLWYSMLSSFDSCGLSGVLNLRQNRVGSILWIFIVRSTSLSLRTSSSVTLRSCCSCPSGIYLVRRLRFSKYSCFWKTLAIDAFYKTYK